MTHSVALVLGCLALIPAGGLLGMALVGLVRLFTHGEIDSTLAVRAAHAPRVLAAQRAADRA